MKTKEIIIPMSVFKAAKTPNKKLNVAAKKLVKQIHKHFKKDKWPLDLAFYHEELFYEVFGHHLENYMLKAIAKSNKKYKIKSSYRGLIITLDE